MKVSLGGRFAPGFVDMPASFQSLYAKIGYVWIDLDDGETIQVFYNSETRLLVVDAGIELVRTTIPEEY